MQHRTLLAAAIVTVGTLTAALADAGQTTPKRAADPSTGHVMVTPADLKWGPAPPTLPAGAQVAVLDGDPGKLGYFSIRLKMPDGYKVAPHWHPTDENIVVLQGVFKVGSGDTYSDSATHELTAGSFAKMPKRMHHFAGAKGETIIQIYGPGPFVVNYLNPADDPSKKSGTP
jgi:quercetin dioxygenase-like cupin family protein